MKSKITAVVSKAIAAARAEIWGDDQQCSPKPAATAVAPGRDRDVEDLFSKLSHVKEGLEIVLARVAYLEQSIHDKEKHLGVGPSDRLIGPNRLKRGKRRDEVLAERAKELWGEEEEEEAGEGENEAICVIKAVKLVKVNVIKGAEKDKVGRGEGEEEGRETEEGSHGKEVEHEIQTAESATSQQQGFPDKKRRGKRGGGGGAKMTTNEAGERDEGSEDGCGSARGGDGGDRAEVVEASSKREGPSFLILLKLYPVLLSWLCVNLFIWQRNKPQEGGHAAMG